MFVPDHTRTLRIFKDINGIGVDLYTNHTMHDGVIVEPTTNIKVYMEPDKLERIGAKL